MNRSVLLVAAFLVDQLCGDPEWMPHPVRLIGHAITRGESGLRREGQSATSELLSGAGLTIAVVASSYWGTVLILKLVRRCSFWATVTELFLAGSCLAVCSLKQEAAAVIDLQQAGALSDARTRLARIVGRDTQNLDGSDVSRAVIETLAESSCDGIVAPMFYMALGGVPLAMAYKAINTLDSMIGHTDSRYYYFGKAAARLDDAANFLPSRLSALAIAGAALVSGGTDAAVAWRTWRRDGSRHRSPNAGQPESAMAGALHVRLGGGNVYSGEWIPAPVLGHEFAPPTPAKAVSAIRLVSISSFIALGFCALSTYLTASIRHSRNGER